MSGIDEPYAMAPAPFTSDGMPVFVSEFEDKSFPVIAFDSWANAWVQTSMGCRKVESTTVKRNPELS